MKKPVRVSRIAVGSPRKGSLYFHRVQGGIPKRDWGRWANDLLAQAVDECTSQDDVPLRPRTWNKKAFERTSGITLIVTFVTF